MTEGICVVCERHGPVGEPCATTACRRRGYCPIPLEYAPGETGASDVRIGQRWGDYLIVERLGVGGVGTVYLALQPPIMLQAALKVLSVDAAQPFVERFRQEAMALARLNHPNIVRMLHFGEHRGTPFLVMEYVPGGRTLRTVDRAALSSDGAFGILRQLCDALEAAHLVGVVHRDVKPGNVMLQALPSQPHFVRLVDFGLAKFADSGHSTGLLAGTPTYMAPEQLTRRDIGPWTDWYAFGVVAFELLTGTLPYPAESTAELVRCKTLPDFEPLAYVADLPQGLRALLRALLAHHPHARPPTGSAVREWLNLVRDDILDLPRTPSGGAKRRTLDMRDEVGPTMPSLMFHPHLPQKSPDTKGPNGDPRSGGSVFVPRIKGVGVGDNPSRRTSDSTNRLDALSSRVSVPADEREESGAARADPTTSNRRSSQWESHRWFLTSAALLILVGAIFGWLSWSSGSDSSDRAGGEVNVPIDADRSVAVSTRSPDSLPLDAALSGPPQRDVGSVRDASVPPDASVALDFGGERKDLGTREGKTRRKMARPTRRRVEASAPTIREAAKSLKKANEMFREGDYSEADRLARVAMRVPDHAQAANYLLAKIFYGKKQYTLAKPYVEQAIARNRKDPLSHLLHGLIRLKLGDPTACESFETVLRIDPSNELAKEKMSRHCSKGR